MTDQTMQDIPSEQKAVLKAFSRALTREAHVLTRQPDLLWQQLYNHLQWEDVKEALTPELALHSAPGATPWLRFDTPYRESDALQRTLEGPTGIHVNACAFSPDGRFIVSAGLDHMLRLWDTTTGQPLRTIEGHTQDLRTCAISPDGHFIASAGGRLVSAPDGTVQVSDGMLDNAMQIWESATGQPVRTLQGHTSQVNACAFSPDGKLVVSASDDGTMRLWEFATGNLLHTLESGQGSVSHCAFSPDGRHLASAGAAQLLVWDVATGKLLREFGHAGSRWFLVGGTCAFSPDGRSIVAESDFPTLRVLDFITGECLHVLEGHGRGILACAFSPDGNHILAAVSDKTLRIWDLSTGKLAQTLEGHTGQVNSCAFSPDGRRIVSASNNGTLRLWDNTTLRPVAGSKDHTDDVTAYACSPDGRFIATAFYENIKIMDAASNQPRQALKSQFSWISQCAFSPDGGSLVSAGENKIGLRGEKSPGYFLEVSDTATGRSLHILEGHTGKINSCAISPDGCSILSTSLDKTLRVWNSATGRLDHNLDLDFSVGLGLFSPDGRFILSMDSIHIKMWDATTFKPVRDLEGPHYGSAGAFSPDGRLVATSGWNFALTIWDIVTGRPLRNLGGHRGCVTHCAFSPDGRFLISASEDKTVRLWNVENSAALAVLPLPGILQSLAFHPWAPRFQCVIEGGRFHGGALYDVHLVGIGYGPLVVTASKVGREIYVHCPVCQQNFLIDQDLLDCEINCPQEGCKTRLALNPFALQRSERIRAEPAARIDDSRPPASPQPDFQALQELAIQAHQAGRFEEALQYFDQALTHKPDDLNLLYFRVASLQKLNRHPEALQRIEAIFSSKLATGVNLGLLYVGKANSLFALGRFEEASAWYPQALELASNYSSVWYMQGCNLFNLKKVEQALESFLRARDLKNDINTCIYIGYCHINLMRFEMAEKEYEDLIADNKGDATIYFSLATAKKALGKRVEALASLERFIQTATAAHQSMMPQAKAMLAELSD